MARTSCILTRWWWCQLCRRLSCLVGYL